MSGIAEVLLASGFEVSGSDLGVSAITKRLEQLGARICIGHRAENLETPNCVVVSSAVRENNPEWKEAIVKKIPVIPRAEMLAELMRLKKGVAVAGSHGKTTTTSMLGQLLRSIDPTVVVGGRLQHWNASSIVGKGQCFVVEADESDRSFLKYNPVYSIVTNVDIEHLDNYKDEADIEKCFTEFLNRTAFFGMNWISGDCPRLKRIRENLRKPVKTYGFDESCDLRIVDSKYRNGFSQFRLQEQDRDLGSFQLPVPGTHNIQNATAAIAVALELGVSLGSIRRNLKSFLPADRRLQIHFESESAVVIEDYAHHPTEIKATLDAIHQKYPDFSLRILFQPHRYSRTAALWNDFVQTLKDSKAKQILLLPIYAAHEDMIEAVNSENLSKEIGDHAQFVTLKEIEIESLVKLLSQETSGKDLFLILGAAPLTKFAWELRDHFANESIQSAAKD